MFIPKKIKAGYNKREDTYTGKLAYVIYYDEKNKLRKETSWNSWKEEDLGSDNFTNDKTEGFVLNKKSGGQRSSWNTRNTYTRVYDPRGFEFEISIPNLLFILENTNSIKGKGLEGEFVYGWEGKELWLIPIDAPEYSEWVNTSKIFLNNTTIKSKDLVVGYTYMTKQEQKWIYLGQFIEYDTYRHQEAKTMPKKHWFVDASETKLSSNKNDQGRWNKHYYENFNSLGTTAITSVPQKIVYCISDEVYPEYPEIMEALEHKSSYVGLKKTVKIKKYIYEDFCKEFKDTSAHWWNKIFYDSSGNVFHIRNNKEDMFEKYTSVPYGNGGYWGENRETVITTYLTIKELFEYGDCNYENYYLSNGKICRTSRTYDISLKEIMEEEQNE